MERKIWRVLRTGLLGKAQALLRGLGPKGEYPSRKPVVSAEQLASAWTEHYTLSGDPKNLLRFTDDGFGKDSK